MKKKQIALLIAGLVIATGIAVGIATTKKSKTVPVAPAAVTAVAVVKDSAAAVDTTKKAVETKKDIKK